MQVSYYLLEKYTEDVNIISQLAGFDLKTVEYPALVILTSSKDDKRGTVVIIPKRDLANLFARYTLMLAALLDDKGK